MDPISEMERALQTENKEKIKKLIKKHGVEKFYSIYSYRTIYHRFVSRNDVRFVEFLLDQGWDIDQKDAFGYNALLTAILRNTDGEEIFDVLVKRGIQINFQLPSGNTPLIYTALYKQKKNGEILIRHGADMNIMNNKGKLFFQGLSNEHLKHWFPIILEHSDKLTEKNWVLLKEKRLQCLLV